MRHVQLKQEIKTCLQKRIIYISKQYPTTKYILKVNLKTMKQNDKKNPISEDDIMSLAIASQSLKNIKQRGATKQFCLIPRALQHILIH